MNDRDTFAALAMVSAFHESTRSEKEIAKDAYAMADAMLAERGDVEPDLSRLAYLHKLTIKRADGTWHVFSPYTVLPHGPTDPVAWGDTIQKALRNACEFLRANDIPHEEEKKRGQH